MSKGTLRRRGKGKVWYGRIIHEGRERERCLETTSKTVARERLNQFIAEQKLSNFGEKPRYKFDDVVRRFSEEHFRVIRPASVRRYEISISHLIDQFQGRYLDEINSDLLNVFEMHRRKKVQPPTIRRDLACLSAMFRCAQTWLWIEANPVRVFLSGQTKLAENPPRFRNLSHQEEADLIQSAIEWWERPNSAGRYPVPWHVIIPLAIDSGLRREEMFSLQRDINVRFDRNEIFIAAHTAKSGRDRRVPILPRSAQLLSSLPVFLKSPWIFHRADGRRYSTKSPYIWESFQKIVRNAGLEDVTLHDLRRTCGCRLLRDRRMSMEEVSKWLGHSSIQVTERVYAFLEIDHLHSAVERTSGNVVTLPDVDRSWTGVRGFSNKNYAGQGHKE